MTGQEHPTIAHTRRLFKARKGPPTEADAPGRRSRGPKPLAGQIDLYGRTHGRRDDAEGDGEEEE
jgi:hypothetical protein